LRAEDFSSLKRIIGEPSVSMPTGATSRREFLRLAGIGGTALLGLGIPSRLLAFTPRQQSQTTITTDMIAQMRASGAKAVLKSEKLRDQVYVITGSGGNVAVLDGPDGKVMVDTGFATSEKQFRTELGSIGNQPLKLLINTHWHFDHTDGNEWLHKAGATILAHENTRLRLSTPQEIAAFKIHFDPSPADALPQQTFAEETKLYLNGESIILRHYEPAHTDSDIFIHFQHADVFHAGDTYFAGHYPMIDASSGGSIGGMIAAADLTLSIVSATTRIISGHGAVTDRQAFQEYRDMLVDVKSRVGKLKQQGKTIDEAVAAKPTADLDAKWSSSGIAPDFFVKLVYSTL
jgi:glyoxylase-like metal-dependent hydrolase (beta-lactamase superfamily II)